MQGSRKCRVIQPIPKHERMVLDEGVDICDDASACVWVLSLFKRNKKKVMEDHAVIRLAKVLSVQADIEAMKAENARREREGMNQAYNEDNFYKKAEELSNLAYAHSDQLH